MNRREITKILSQASREEVAELARPIRESCEVKLVKPPQKSLVMVKVREPIKRTLFYLGEVLACECMVSVGGVHGISVMMGDDFDKVIDGAVIDGALTKGIPDCPVILERINELNEKQKAERARLNRELRKSKVQFSVMGGE